MPFPTFTPIPSLAFTSTPLTSPLTSDHSQQPLTTSLTGPSSIVFNHLQLPGCTFNRPALKLGYFE